MKQRGRDSCSVLIPLRSGCILSSIPTLTQHIWAVKAFFSYKRDISRLNAALQPMWYMSGLPTAQAALMVDGETHQPPHFYKRLFG